MNQTLSEIWVRFATAAMIRGGAQSISHCAKAADEMLAEYEKRYGETAVIVDGITKCSQCSQHIPKDEGRIARDSVSGEYYKFCAECVKAASAGKRLVTSPRTTVCTACGLDENNIFSCPGEPRPPENMTVSPSAYEAWIEEDRVWHGKLKVRPLGEKHSFEKEEP